MTDTVTSATPTRAGDLVFGGADAAAVLAARVTSADFQDLVEVALDHAADVVLDTIAAVAAFDEDDTFPAYVARLAGPNGIGPATLFGTGERTAPLVAAAVNGAQANAVLLAEGHRGAGGHPAAHLVPGIVAAAQSVPGSETLPTVSGHALLRAVVVGYEVAVRVREFIGPLRAALSPNGNWSAIGAAAGVAWLLGGGDARTVRAAINTAAALAPAAPMSFGHEGAEGYRHFVEVAAQLGLTAGAGAAQGWKSPAGILENEYARRSTGVAPADTPETLGGDRPLAITENYFKRHAVCAHLAAVADAAVSLHEAGIEPDAIHAVEVRCGVAGTCEMDDPWPGNRFAARYSLPIVLGVGIARGGTALSSFPASILDDDLVLAIASRTTVRHDASLGAKFPHGRPAAVLARLADGTEREAIAGVPLGDAQNPMTRQQLHTKAHNILSRARGETVADALLAARQQLVDDAPVDVLTAALEGGTPWAS